MRGAGLQNFRSSNPSVTWFIKTSARLVFTSCSGYVYLQLCLPIKISASPPNANFHRLSPDHLRFGNNRPYDSKAVAPNSHNAAPDGGLMLVCMYGNAVMNRYLPVCLTTGISEALDVHAWRCFFNLQTLYPHTFRVTIGKSGFFSFVLGVSVCIQRASVERIGQD